MEQNGLYFLEVCLDIIYFHLLTSHIWISSMNRFLNVAVSEVYLMCNPYNSADYVTGVVIYKVFQYCETLIIYLFIFL